MKYEVNKKHYDQMLFVENGKVIVESGDFYEVVVKNPETGEAMWTEVARTAESAVHRVASLHESIAQPGQTATIITPTESWSFELEVGA